MRKYMTSRAMRAKAAEIGVNIADMISTQVRRAGEYDWNDAMIAKIEKDIVKAKRKRANLIARANGYDYAA